MQEVICDDLLVDIVLRSALLQYPKCLGEMFVQRHGFVAEFANE